MWRGVLVSEVVSWARGGFYQLYKLQVLNKLEKIKSLVRSLVCILGLILKIRTYLINYCSLVIPSLRRCFIFG